MNAVVVDPVGTNRTGFAQSRRFSNWRSKRTTSIGTCVCWKIEG
jgi:hypothetical protein